MASPGKKGIRFSRLYSFSCFRSSFRDEHSQIGLKGYSRVVYCNDPDNPEQILPSYPRNYVSTTKYTALNFIPKSLFEQFRRVANIYFLVVACVSFSPLAPYSAYSVLLPLLLVIGATIGKEAIEDWRRKKQDIEANNRKVKVYDKDHGFLKEKWRNLRVGDLVKVHKDEHFPADLLLLSSSYEDGICYVETTNLDGETNLKVKHALDVTCTLNEDDSFEHFKAVIKCEDPNEDLYSFVGTLYYNNKQHPLSLQQLLLRDSKLRNTDYVYGVVVFTDHDTKVMKNSMEPPSKRSRIERKMDKIVYVLFSLLVFVSLVGSFFFGIMTESDIDDDGEMRRWYLRPDQTTAFFDPNDAFMAAFLHLLTGLMLYGYLIPISLYVSIEIVKVLQIIFINQDINMYHEETDGPATAKTSNLNEELGLVDTILSDKTGTLTCNSMEFVKCSIVGTAYGRGLTEVERALAKRRGDALDDSEVTSSASLQSDDGMAHGESVKGFNFYDERVMNGQWVNEPHADMIQKFFRVLALCHTAIPEVDKEGKGILYEAESPDEAAFVIAARELGFEMYKRTQSHISLSELDHESHQKVDRPYELLHVLEFSSSRRRMSVIVRNVENQLLLLSKGSDIVMLERLSKNSQDFEATTMEHVKRYAEAGLRTLVLAYRELSEEEFSSWEKEFRDAKATVGPDRDALIEAAADKIERDLILLGATAVEDKLQKGVPECIERLEKAGIKIWVITGDKMETAINIGFACSLLREDMEQIVITLDSPEIIELERKGDKEAVAKASRKSITNQIRQGMLLLSSSGGNFSFFALIIDGKSLSFILSDDLEGPFWQLAVSCASVICCRSTPKQKALITRLVKKSTGRTTLAIGDGANDVGMLQEADIGVGISGVEGMQAVMASDFAIAQFRFLERLLLVHGHWCYRRISMMVCYFFYKNIAFGFTLFWFEAYASFSGQPAYNDWYMSCYNVFFTSLPVIALGVFDQDVSPRLCLKNPELYQEGIQNILFSWPRILGWILNGIICSVVVFFFTTSSALHQAFREDGRVLDFEALGVYMYTCVVWAVNCQMALSINYFTWMQHFVIWGSIAVWYAFLLIYGAFPPLFSTTAYQVFVEACGPSPIFWLGTLLAVVSCLLPYVLYRTVQTEFFPMPHDIIQKWQRETSDDSRSKQREKDTLLCK
ncbi:probable phospholipid-transporting ATPase 8 [Salvia hispanica]|uniref:probable phospholipid-transporting ATPase 8 n=1 Tax=Salvia hispanica TaxID=49212 RepID=UPI0020092F56|nr:probable phospholipid-transporting ATPase 8 [Salvia hispanica]XP_047963027.1 probable phospholipid-transporting ATPase 8 [Salvia hispanica]XP_047963028.1 probable phospholipid-transporting ATPase 8 [Salvia hispanica]